MSQYKQIGNAVPVNFAEYLGRHVIRILEEQPDAITNSRQSRSRSVAAE